MTGEPGGNDGNNKKNIFKKHITGLFFFKGEFALFSFQLSDLCRLVFGGDSAVFFFGLFFFIFNFFSTVGRNEKRERA